MVHLISICEHQAYSSKAYPPLPHVLKLWYKKMLFCTECIFRLVSPTTQRSFTMSQQDLHANQSTPNNPAHQATLNNRANQLNPNNPAYHSSRQGGGKGK